MGSALPGPGTLGYRGGRLALRLAASLPGVCLASGSGLRASGVRGRAGPVLFAPVALCLQELFKAFARHLSHALAQKASPGRSVKEEAQDFIKQFFHGRARCESEADWHGLCDPQR